MRCPFCTNGFVHVACDPIAGLERVSCAHCGGRFTITLEDMNNSPRPIAAPTAELEGLTAIEELHRARVRVGRPCRAVRHDAEGAIPAEEHRGDPFEEALKLARGL